MRRIKSNPIQVRFVAIFLGAVIAYGLCAWGVAAILEMLWQRYTFLVITR